MEKKLKAINAFIKFKFVLCLSPLSLQKFCNVIVENMVFDVMPKLRADWN